MDYSCVNPILCITLQNLTVISLWLLRERKTFWFILNFHEVWQWGLLYNIWKSGIASNLLNILTDSLKDRKQRLVLHSKHLLWIDHIEGGDFQELVLALFVFFYIWVSGYILTVYPIIWYFFGITIILVEM